MQMRKLLGAILIIAVVLIIGMVMLIYSQGTRIDAKGKISGIGILDVDTTPNDAKIFVDNDYKTTSDRNIENLKKGKYTVRIEKDHYTTWEKIIEIKEGLITPLVVTLYPTNPSLTAFTFDGVYAPKLSSDNKKVVFGIQTSTKSGLWVLDLNDPQLFFDNRLKKIAADTSKVQFSKSNFAWDADNKNIFVETQVLGSTEVQSFLLDASQETNSPQELGANAQTEKQKIETALAKRNQDKLAKFDKTAQELAKNATSLFFSKDNKAVIITKEGQTVVYDSEPSQVPNSKPVVTTLPTDATYFFLQDPENHIVSVEKNILSVLDRDGTNKVNLFTGDFDPSSVYSWPDGNRIIVSLNLNSKQNPLPNLYSIDLK